MKLYRKIFRCIIMNYIRAKIRRCGRVDYETTLNQIPHIDKIDTKQKHKKYKKRPDEEGFL